MMVIDLLEETYSVMTSNKARSGLTILGIVIGIASVIAMISIGQGATSDISSKIQSLGSNLLIVMPGSQKTVGSKVQQGMGSATTLVTEDAKAILAEVTEVKTIAPEVSTRKQVNFKGNNTNTSIYGVMPDYLVVKSIELSAGSFITEQQVKKMSKVAILGPTTAKTLFEEMVDPLGQKIKIDNISFTVVGLTTEEGGTSMGSSDDRVLVPLSTAQHYLTGSDSLSNINIEIREESLMTQAEENVSNLLLARHNISNPEEADFQIMNQANIMDTMSSVTRTLTLLLGAIAGISLIVGGIGIMNMMLTTVTERTREIGLRKSLGAKKKDISIQFLTESVMLTFIGGIIGIFLGYLASLLVTKFSGITTEVSSLSVLLAFGVSAAIGIIFGYYPARRAAKLDPIEALRYE